MELRQADNTMVGFILIMLLSTGSAEIDEDWKFCGTWLHGKGPLNLNLSLTTGCAGVLISANESSLSISGQITARCKRSEVIALGQGSLYMRSDFCLSWETLQDQLTLKFNEETYSLCPSASVWSSCCSQLSHGPNSPERAYGILDGAVITDVISNKVHESYIFNATATACNSLLNEVNLGSATVTLKEDKGNGSTAEIVMLKNFRGYNITSPATTSAAAERPTTVQIPSAMKEAAHGTNKVLCTFLNENNPVFKEAIANSQILKVVEITVGNDVIKNLSEPVRIGFHHGVLPKNSSRKCVSTDSRIDPSKIKWVTDGCQTKAIGPRYTECLCDHLTFFTVMVQMQPRPVRHLLALTAITSLGCAVSVISCIALIVFFCRKSKRCKEQQSLPIHLGLAISLLLLHLFFFFTGVVANVGGEAVCVWVAAALHYALLSSFSWMGIEVFLTFWLVYVIFSPSPKPYLWYLVGFGLPFLPVCILLAVGDIYGLREVDQEEDLSDPFKMCWMTTDPKALLAHYVTNLTLMPILVISGFVMLVLIYRQIHRREEWSKNRVAFFSIWGLSCLFGTTWGLTFLDFGPLSEFALFLACILLSFQGFLLMLRFYMLDWMRKQTDGSVLGSSSTGSTRQHMLKAMEKS